MSLRTINQGKWPRRKQIIALAIAGMIISVLFVPLPGAKAVTVSISNGNIGNGSSTASLAITAQSPTAIVFPNGQTTETIPQNFNIKVSIDGGAETATFDLSGHSISTDTSGAITRLVLNGVQNGNGNLIGLIYGYFYGYGYGIFNNYYGYGTIGNGSSAYGLSSYGFTQTTTGSYSIGLNPSKLSTGQHTIQVQVFQNSGSTSSFVGSATFNNAGTVTPPYITALQQALNARSDVQASIDPIKNLSIGSEVQNNDFSGAMRWAAIWGFYENSNLKQYDPIYTLMWIYSFRSDLQTAFPEAANGQNLAGLIQWAASSGINEPNVPGSASPLLAVHKAWYLAEWVRNFRSDLQPLFGAPEKGTDATSLFAWAQQHGLSEPSAPGSAGPILGSSVDAKALYAMYNLYNCRADLKQQFPEAKNGGEFIHLYNWEVNFGQNEPAAGICSGASVVSFLPQYQNPSHHVILGSSAYVAQFQPDS